MSNDPSRLPELANYESSHRDLFADPDFARWYHSSYVPIAGGWQY